MTLKGRIKKLETAVGMEDPIQGATALVRAAIQYGILPPDIDFEAEVKGCAKAGLSLSNVMAEVIGGIHAKSNGLPKLPCQQEDLDWSE